MATVGFVALIGGVFTIKSLSMDEKIKKVCYHEHCFEVEIAQTAEEKKKGLMERKSLKENKGMLFVYDEERVRSFWMKNTLIPLDIIWLDAEKKVIHIKHNAPPCKNKDCPSYGPEKPCKYVLEIKGGTSEKIGLNKGARLEFK